MKNNEAVADEPPSTSSDDAVPEPAVGSVVIAPPEAGARRTALLRSAACSLPLEQLLCGCALNVELLQPDGWCYAPRRWLCAAEPARRAAVRAVLRPLSANRGVGGLRRGTLPGAAQLPIRCFVAARAAARRAACAACCARWAGNSARPGWGAPPAGAQVHGRRRVRLLPGTDADAVFYLGVRPAADGASVAIRPLELYTLTLADYTRCAWPSRETCNVTLLLDRSRCVIPQLGPTMTLVAWCLVRRARVDVNVRSNTELCVPLFPTCCVASQQHTYSQQ